VQHAYPFALNRPLIASFQLCSPLVFVFPLGVRPLSLDSPVFSLFLVLRPLPLELGSELLALFGEPPPSEPVSWPSEREDRVHSQLSGVWRTLSLWSLLSHWFRWTHGC
jgi:hypothetical protein